MPESTRPSSQDRIGLFVTVATLPAAVLLAARLATPFAWLLPLTSVALVGAQLFQLRKTQRSNRAHTERTDSPAS
jgi:hypothetical protein